MEQWAIVLSSGRIVPVIRWGRVLIVLHGARGVSTVRYDQRFHLMPKGYKPEARR